MIFMGICRTLFEREHDEVRIGKELLGFGYDYRDHSRYHLVLDSGKLSVDEEVEAVQKVMG